MKISRINSVILISIWIGTVIGRNRRNGKLFSIFNVVRFPNDLCPTSVNRNGTCLTENECTARDGSASGTCASGYGVCCVFSMSCGSTSSANCSYIEQSSINSASSLTQNPCLYTLCPLSRNICRLRLDFTTNVLADPASGMAVAIAETPSIVEGGALGDCVDDVMTLSTPGRKGPPSICGFNTGQHMIVDITPDRCNVLSFLLSSSTSTTRQWSIKTTQYICGDELGSGGPPGCLQYHTASSGSIASFNFDTSVSNTVSTSATHLSNQQYDICIRRATGHCRICYYPRVVINAIESFGLSISGAAIVTANLETGCTSDWISIPEGHVLNPAIAAPATAPTGLTRFCGRFLAPTVPATASVTLCSVVTPFTVGVNFDSDEFTSSAAATMAQLNELQGIPSGTVGFWLDYVQSSC